MNRKYPLKRSSSNDYQEYNLLRGLPYLKTSAPKAKNKSEKYPTIPPHWKIIIQRQLTKHKIELSLAG